MVSLAFFNVVGVGVLGIEQVPRQKNERIKNNGFRNSNKKIQAKCGFLPKEAEKCRMFTAFI